MSVDKFGEYMKTVCDRVATLYQQAGDPMQQQPDLLEDSIEQLRTALEELRVAEEEMREQNEELIATRIKLEVERHRYQELFEEAPDGYLVTDENGLIREANRAAATLLNIPVRFLVGKPLVNFVPQSGRRVFRAKLLQLLHIDRIQEWEVQLQGRDNSIFEAALTVTTVRDSEGSPVFFRWLMRDITVRKQAEEQIRCYELQNLQLLEESRLKSEFLAIMSHELRTPLTAIIGFSQLLLRQLQEQLIPKQVDMLDRILQNGKNMLSLINYILDFSKLKAGSLELKEQVFDVAELVRATVEEIRGLAIAKHLQVYVKLTIQNSQVLNDSDRLKQVLINLLCNAIKFTERGSVSVEVWELNPDKIAIEVRDTGIGIAEADLKDIFKEFWQLNQTNARSHSGIGLGLAISDELVRLMNGTIRVESQPGQGSTFRIELPRIVR